MAANFAWNARGRNSVPKPDGPLGGLTCTRAGCGHVELAHQRVAGALVGPCMYRGCDCDGCDVDDAEAVSLIGETS